MADCIFCRIIRGEAPAKKVYEDERAFVFEDIMPQAPTHVLIIPKKHIVGLKEAGPEDVDTIGHLHLVAARIARERGIEDGYRTVFNVGPRAGQSVFHLHLHLLGGRSLRWPPG
ncbi:MAG TPA: histidine triad nucleotide-binding protein [Terriglobales bacterium]|nr:histidine triad nucleotide-binding protein [Terriglobales bacterium]